MSNFSLIFLRIVLAFSFLCDTLSRFFLDGSLGIPTFTDEESVNVKDTMFCFVDEGIPVLLCQHLFAFVCDVFFRFIGLLDYSNLAYFLLAQVLNYFYFDALVFFFYLSHL